MSSSPSEESRAADRAAIEAIRAGDPTAYRELVERYQSRVYALICGMVKNREEAEDLTQEVFIKAYRNLDRFRLESSFYTWLYRIAMNRAIDHVRKVKRRPVSEFDETVASRDADGELNQGHLDNNPRQSLERQQLNRRIMDALDTLSPDHRQIILLREVEGLSYREISETVGVPEGTVMSRLYYARRKLQQILKGEMER